MSKGKTAILDAGLFLAAIRGLNGFSSPELARFANMSNPMIFYHFGDMDGFRTALAEYAIVRDDKSVIAQMIVANHLSVAAWSRRRRARYLSGS